MDDFISQMDSDSEKEWKQRIQYELNGIEYNTLLKKDSFEKINTKPFYTTKDSLKLFSTKYFTKESLIVKSVYVKDELKANSIAKRILQNEVNTIKFVINNSKTNYEILCEGIDSEKIILMF